MGEQRVRVAHLIPTLSLGGAARLVIDLAGMLRRDGYDADIVTGRQTESGHTLADDAKALGVPVHVIPTFFRDPHPVADALAVRDLTRFLRAGGFDIVHTHGTKGLLLGTWAARRARIKHTVWHVHGWGFHDYNSLPTRAALVLAHRLMARTASRVAAVSDATRRIGLRSGIGSPGDYCVVYAAADLDRFREPPLSSEEAKHALGIRPDRLVFGSITRLSDQKAPLDLVEAAATVLAAVPKAHFLLVGDGPLREAVVRRVRRHGIEGRSTLPGATSEAPEVLAAFDVFALSSLWEGFPISYLEAMAMGKPAVGTNVGGAAEAIIDGETGFVVPPRDPDALAERVIRLLGDGSLRRSMGERGRQVAAQFGYDRLMREVSSLYADLLNGQAK
jgi:glycosyltransferase involved in cell wall biosynthesis